MDNTDNKRQPLDLTKLLSYGDCPDCGLERVGITWCQNCDINLLKENFSGWSSGDPTIDEFIKFTQLNSAGSMDYLEWIDFEKLEFVENKDKRGAFSSIYSAIWLEGPKLNLDEEADIWTRCGPTKVILKRLDNSQNLSQEFMNKVSILNVFQLAKFVSKHNTITFI